MKSEMHALAETFQQALASGDLEALDRLYADDIVIWHNYDRIDRDKAHSVAGVGAMHRELAHFGIANVRRDYLDDGYVQQTVFQLLRHDGTRSEVDAMMRVWVRADGRIERIEEYSNAEPHPITEPSRERASHAGSPR